MYITIVCAGAVGAALGRRVIVLIPATAAVIVIVAAIEFTAESHTWATHPQSGRQSSAFLHSLDPECPQRLFHAILVDIDHSPRHVLHPSHAELYEAKGLRRLSSHLHPNGVFALWSNDPPDE
jgi:hypothetical protein